MIRSLIEDFGLINIDIEETGTVRGCARLCA